MTAKRSDSRRPGSGRALRKASIGALILCLLCFLRLTAAHSSAPSVWDVAKSVRDGAGGMEAERDTWTRTSRSLQQTSSVGRQEWKVHVRGDARPVMRKLTIESLEGTIEAPFVLSDKNYDFRSVPELVASVTRGASTPEQKALALRELLIGEGFFFHHSTPIAVDPIQRLTNSGYGFCGVHAQIYDQLAGAAGLRVRTCAHRFAYGHATNEVFYEGQWHFIDTNGEAFFRRPDGVIPSYEDIHNNPSLVPTGDAYGQTSFGIDGARYSRALYSAPTTCLERKSNPASKYGTLDFPLREGESITWEWRDSDFARNRANGRPSFGEGKIEYRPSLRDLAGMATGLRGRAGSLERAHGVKAPSLRIPVHSAYPIFDVSASVTGDGEGIAARISKDGGKTWSTLNASRKGRETVWHADIDQPDKCVFVPDRASLTDTSRSVIAASYGYLLEFSLSSVRGRTPTMEGLNIVSKFRHYPPALPYLETGDNVLTYVDRGKGARRARVTLEWEERVRPADLGMKPVDWGWGDVQLLSEKGSENALPVVEQGVGGALHLVYATGPDGQRRIAYRKLDGERWSEEKLLTASGQDANHPVVAEDEAGTVWVAYQTGGLWKGGDVFVLAVKGSSVSEPTRLNSNDPYHIAFFPSISTHGRRVVVSWEGGEPGVDLTNAWGTEVGWIRVFDGARWNDPTLVKGEPFKNLGLPKVVFDQKGRLHLTGTKGPRYYRTLSPQDSSASYQWLTPEWMYHSRGGSIRPDPAGNIWAIFDGQNSGTTNEIYLRMLSGSAVGTVITQWTPALRISEDDKRPSLYPDVVASGTDALAVVWMDYRHEVAQIYSKVFRNGRWSPDMAISADVLPHHKDAKLTPNQILSSSPAGVQSGYPRIRQAGATAAWAVWQETQGAVSRIVTRRLDLSR